MTSKSVTGRSGQPARTASMLGAIRSGVHQLAKAIYLASAREVHAIGVEVDEEAFDAAALMFVDAKRLTRTEEQDELQRINAAGFFDMEISGTPVRVKRHDP